MIVIWALIIANGCGGQQIRIRKCVFVVYALASIIDNGAMAVRLLSYLTAEEWFSTLWYSVMYSIAFLVWTPIDVYFTTALYSYAFNPEVHYLEKHPEE